MKAALVLCCLALFMALYAADDACNPNGNNKPDCTNSSNHGIKIRNFWDPTRYWECNSDNVAEAVVCETFNDDGTVDTKGFLEAKQICVSWSEWTWTQPCA